MKEYTTWETLVPDLKNYDAFHGTTLDNLESIRRIGLIGLLGNFVQEAYDDEIEMYMDYYNVDSIQELEHELGDRLVVFFAQRDPKKLHRAFNAIFSQIGNRLGKSMHDVTAEDVAQHGVLLALESAEGLYEIDENQEIWEITVDDYEGDYELTPASMERPLGAETGDWFSPSAGTPDAAIMGGALIELIKETGYPISSRNW